VKGTAPSGTFYGSAIFHGQKLLTFAGRDLQSQYYDELKLCKIILSLSLSQSIYLSLSSPSCLTISPHLIFVTVCLPTVGMAAEEDTDIASLIPDEVWLHLFSYIQDIKTLCMVSAVCKRFQHPSYIYNFP